MSFAPNFKSCNSEEVQLSLGSESASRPPGPPNVMLPLPFTPLHKSVGDNSFTENKNMVLLNLEKSQKVSIIELLALQRVSPSLPASSLSSEL